MQKRTIRAVCAVIALLMLVPMMFACNNEGETETSGNQTINPGQVETKEELVLPENHKYDGETFTVLTAGNVAYNDFDFTEEEESVLGQAQYKRVQVILQENDVIIEPIKDENKSSFGAGPGYKRISEAVIAEDITYHLGVIGGYDVAKLAEGNYLYDLNSLPYVETSKSWWDQNANDDLTINGMLFFTNGSLTAAYSQSTYTIYLNKALAEEAIPGVDIYQIVKDMKWTIDKLGEFSKTVSEDLGGNGVMDPSDRYGLYVWDDSILGMMGAAGTKCATVGEDGKIQLTLYNDNTLNMFNKFTEIAYNKEYALTYQRFNSSQLNGGVVVGFQENRALLWATSNTNTAKIRDMEASFGIIPYPMLSEEQGRYYSTIAPYNSQFICVPFMTDDDIAEMVGVVTESLAYYGKTITWPACYEQTLKGAFARDDGTMEMLDIIYGSYVYDIGYYYQIGSYHSEMMKLLRAYSNTFNSMYETSRESAQQQLDTINANYAEVLNEWKKA